jgi:predicted ester cyclase
MSSNELADRYRGYIDCLNRQDWAQLHRFVHDEVRHNGRPLGLAGYRAMLEQDYRDIPDLRFEIDWLVSEPPRVAARLAFDCTPRGRFLGLAVDGRRVAFAEHVFYRFQDGKVHGVWSILDKTAIEDQLTGVPSSARAARAAGLNPAA